MRVAVRVLHSCAFIAVCTCMYVIICSIQTLKRGGGSMRGWSLLALYVRSIQHKVMVTWCNDLPNCHEKLYLQRLKFSNKLACTKVSIYYF